MLCMRIGRRIDSTSSVSIIKTSVHKDVRMTKNSYADPETLGTYRLRSRVIKYPSSKNCLGNSSC